MAYTEDDRTALQKAIASGELRVQYQDRAVTYRSIYELQRALAAVESVLDSASPAPRQTRVLTRKGWA